VPLRAPALASLMAALLAVAADGQDRVLLLVSGGPEAYRRAEAGVRAALAARGSSIEVQVVPAEDAQAALAGKPDAVVAVGAKAAEVAQRAGARPLVYAMVLDPRALVELIPDLEQKHPPLGSKVHEDRIVFTAKTVAA